MRRKETEIAKTISENLHLTDADIAARIVEVHGVRKSVEAVKKYRQRLHLCKTRGRRKSSE